jgi:rubrerythrin
MLGNVFRKKRKQEGIGDSKGQVKIAVICRQCGFKVTEPDVIRCPRCFELVLEHQCGGCGKCNS